MSGKEEAITFGRGYHTEGRHIVDACLDKIRKIGFNIFPSPRLAQGVVEPYNAVLSTRLLMEHTDVAVTLDNEALYDICERNLRIDRPSFSNVNQVIAQVVSSLTPNIRFNDEKVLNEDLDSFRTNLVPYPRLIFMLSSFAPLRTSDICWHSCLSTNELVE